MNKQKKRPTKVGVIRPYRPTRVGWMMPVSLYIKRYGKDAYMRRYGKKKTKIKNPNEHKSKN